MTIKKLAGIVTVIITFAIGCLLVHLNIGKFGLCAFFGYLLCTAAILIAIVALSTVLVFKGERKGYERKNN
ncbi:MAG: hypothetical protein ACI4IG_02610 [Eubacterium sp.]